MPGLSKIRFYIGKFATFFTRAKVPAWAVILWEAFQIIPDWKSRVDFWLAIAKGTGGFWGGVATVISVPYFNLGLTAAALLWLGFAGEPKKFVQRHPWLPYLGWAVFGIVLAAIGSSLITGYFELRVKEEVARRDAAIQHDAAVRPVFWHLTDLEKTNLAHELGKIPEAERFPVTVKCLPDAGSRAFVEELAKVFIDEKWKITANCFFSNIRPDLTGLYIGVPKEQVGKKNEELPKNLATLLRIFSAAQLRGNGIATDDTLKGDQFAIIVGNAP